MSRRRLVLLEALAHAIAAGALLAFAGFALRGYDTATIVLSALHVVLWIAFAAAAWRLPGNGHGATLQRAALAFLVLAGLATLAPVTLMVRGVTDPWLQQLGVKLFLTPFVNGFLLLCALAVVYGGLSDARRARLALVLIAAGTLPAALLHVQAAPPAAWLTLVGRAGVTLTGAGVLLFGFDVLRARTAAVLRIVGGFALLAGALQLLAGAGVGASFMHHRFITVAYLHVLLLGVITPALLHGVRPQHAVADARAAVFAGGVVALCGALLALGWPAAARALAGAGVHTGVLLKLSFAGGVVAAVALIALCGRRARATSHNADVPEQEVRPSDTTPARRTPERAGSSRRSGMRRPARVRM